MIRFCNANFVRCRRACVLNNRHDNILLLNELCVSVVLKGSDVITYNYLHSIILFLEPIMSWKYFKIGFMQWPRKYINDIGTRLKVRNRLLTNTEIIKLSVCFNIFKYFFFFGFHGWYSLNRDWKTGFLWFYFLNKII